MVISWSKSSLYQVTIEFSCFTGFEQVPAIKMGLVRRYELFFRYFIYIRNNIGIYMLYDMGYRLGKYIFLDFLFVPLYHCMLICFLPIFRCFIGNLICFLVRRLVRRWFEDSIWKIVPVSYSRSDRSRLRLS